MAKTSRIDQINIELFALKLELNSNYGLGPSEVERCIKIQEQRTKLLNELAELNGYNREGVIIRN